MRLLDRLTVARRLAAGFGLTAALLLAVCGLSAFNASTAAQVVGVRLATLQHHIDQAHGLVVLQQGRDLNIRQIGLLVDVIEMQRRAKLAQDANGLIAKALEQLLAGKPGSGQRALLADTQAIDSRYRPLASKAINLALAVPNEDAAKIITGQLDALSVQQRQALERYSLLQQRQADLARQQMAADAAQGSVLMGAAALVASAVRSPAQRSATAPREIKRLIAADVEQVEQGAQLVGDASRTAAGVVGTATRVAVLIAQISGATDQQANGPQQISTAVSAVDQSTQQNAALVAQSTAAAQSLTERANPLGGAVGQFQLGQAA